MDKLFIVGCPRSGTTMVQQALNRHSQVVIPPETKFFFSFYGQSWKRQRRHLERLSTDLDIQLPELTRRVASVADGRDFYELMARRYVERRQKPGVTCFGEKTPEHSGHLPRIRQFFPDAKVLVLYRDGRDVAASLTRMPWMSPDLYVCFLVWLYYARVLRNAQQDAGPHVYFARYEDIVAAPEKEFGAILRFLDLPYEPAVAKGCGNREGVPEREYAWKERALQKITTQRVGLFRNELSAVEIETLESLGRHALPTLGYRLLSDGQKPLSPGFLLNLSWNLSRFICRLPWSSLVNELVGRALSPRVASPSLSPPTFGWPARRRSDAAVLPAAGAGA